ncbi:bifunctional serine/threonine-protein kinase/ABC transporter substrate-binding protein [Streptomyces sp. NBC_01239]|uniref:bifunctional serine/threonine-protein kinase/ABC transporter substrate-binding protein n=1 Tax=Streptomyces sp. NBC_01239 TaxID=2903792 RepID=UPI002251848D|nr:bifunctional serine/threonine-protein kinase/ABC transporter substrate-binding protein [Streptomyces sp. NBC_01239]MCX4818001.1 bifunctional serine/threonine-protein kinase/ABC transporter substrate-binding protein [Streptomyces sp. NBC_01239]
MERLLPSDPSRLGGYRLLGRLGAGGMGVVYLARGGAGELAAVKVIQPEFAEQAEFRARFRREADSARGVDSPWVVPVLGADTEGPAPWLATAFVPGPSLAEAVAECGPLPTRVVRVLGKVLARALDAVHEAGLVHRDVKPGNVLLALDGPRLIDFGIARPTASEETELTSDSMVVGTPGFLSPEQARALPVGPASDVFALGCVLAYTATGRLPFGSGTADALLYRTVHDTPDLDGVEDVELRALLERCLAKEPERRPQVGQIEAELVEDAPAGSIDWLPDPVVRMVAERSTRMLALPGIEPTEVSGDTEVPGPGRRRVLALAGGTALLAVGGGAGLWAILRDNDRKTPASSTGRRDWVIGVQADLSGPLKATGTTQERAARLAVEEFNARKNKPFPLTLRVLDDRGDPARAQNVARQLTSDSDVFAVLGPTGYASAQSAVEVYESAGLPLVTVSELSVSAVQSALLAKPKSYFRAAPLIAYSAFATVTALATQGSRRPGLLVDRAGGITGMESVNVVHSATRAGGEALYARVVPALAPDVSTVVADMLAHGVDSFYYTGTPERAASLARALAARKFTGPRFLDVASATPAFVTAADPASEGWQALAPYIDPAAPAVRPFATAYRKRYGGAPGDWAAEAYDVTRLIADRLTHLAGSAKRRPTRAQVSAALAKARFKGLVTTYSFDADHQLVTTQVQHYRVHDGRFDYAGPAGLSA